MKWERAVRTCVCVVRAMIMLGMCAVFEVTTCGDVRGIMGFCSVENFDSGFSGNLSSRVEHALSGAVSMGKSLLRSSACDLKGNIKHSG